MLTDHIILEIEGDIENYVDNELINEWGNTDNMIKLDPTAVDDVVKAYATKFGHVKVKVGDEDYKEILNAEIIDVRITNDE